MAPVPVKMGLRMIGVTIRGVGVAAYACEKLLADAGCRVTLEGRGRPKLPAIILGATAQKLVNDIFGADLFTGLPKLSRRVVAWGKEARTVEVQHSAVVVSEQELWRRIQERLPERSDKSGGASPTWVVYAGRPLPDAATELHFGSRVASATAVKLKGDRESCYIESLEKGWLFLIPGEDGWLLAVGAPADTLLAGSRLVAAQIRSLGNPLGEFPAYPRIGAPLGAPGWLACGTAALGFDPLCGDGTGHAIREAILASAAIRAGADGDTADLVAHYQSRLLAGFQRHLEMCLSYYDTGLGSWWDREVGLLREGLTWCARQLKAQPPAKYRLNGFVLEPLPYGRGSV
jgi:hypothetical protein